MDWKYAGDLDKANIRIEEKMQIESLVRIAEQLERLNKNLNAEMKVKVSGVVITHVC